MEKKDILDLIEIRTQAANRAQDTVIRDMQISIKSMQSSQNERHQQIMDMLQPISDSYKSATTLGKWLMAGAVFISIMMGIILSYKSLK